MNDEFRMFLSPGKIGTLELKNRCIMPPMGTHCVGPDLMVPDRLCEYHKRRALGGCALNITEVCLVHPSGESGIDLAGYNDTFLPGLTRLADAIHAGGGKACLQLWHPGRQGESRGNPWAPSPIPCPVVGIVPHEMTEDEIWEVIAAYGDTALRAKRAGYDAVELHAGHGYLVDEFFNEYTNHRTDAFGGSFENRTRFAMEIIKDIKKKVGDDFPLIVRMNGQENAEGGIVIEDAIEIAKLFEKAGVHALDISQGAYTVMSSGMPPYFYPEALNAENSAAIKANVSIPVICVGRITTPMLAEKLLREGKGDFVAIGKGQLADPDFVKKAAEGRADEIIRCIGCTQACVGGIRKHDVTCVFNPVTGHEKERTVQPAEVRKNVLVIGGGPGGLEAAWVAAQRGHSTTLIEKTAQLGGQFLLASVAPKKAHYADAVKLLAMRAIRAGAQIHLATEATPEKIAQYAPDEIVIACGSTPVIPKLPGLDALPSYTAHDVLARKTYVSASEVAVIGGGLVGVEVAEILALQGKKVHIVEMLDVIGSDVELLIKRYMNDTLNRLCVATHPGTRCKELYPDHIAVETNGEAHDIPCGAVVFAVGSRCNTAVVDMVKETGIPYHVVGDAQSVGKVQNAIWTAHEAARNI